MQKKTNRKPTRSGFSLLHQLCNLIPNRLVPQLPREHAVEEKSRTFRPLSHVVSLLCAQVTHALGLNDICATLIEPVATSSRRRASCCLSDG